MSLRSIIFFFFGIFFSSKTEGQVILEVGVGKKYSNPQTALQQAKPGDTVLIFPGVYSGDYFLSNLHGTRKARITIRGTKTDSVIIEGSQSFHFAEITFVNIQNLTIRRQSANGMNLDDGGTYETPSKNVLIKDIRFMDMNASGNNDMLKLSGLDSFEVSYCTFMNGSAGGSGIDMVGCHNGWIHHCIFLNQGSNSIQAKGGTKDIHIERNTFRNGGSRVLNLGGSTGQAFFRPLGINYEAKDLIVSGNFFDGSDAPIAYVGSRNVLVSNNTFYNPTKWIFRILQESSDTSFYLSSANNTFCNNIIYAVSIDPTINIGPNTSEKSYTICNNLWFSTRTNNWRGPSLPVKENNGIYSLNPQLEDIAQGKIKPKQNSPVIGKGLGFNQFSFDYYDQKFSVPPSIGASEYIINTLTNSGDGRRNWNIYPNPNHGVLFFEDVIMENEFVIYNLSGQELYKVETNGSQSINLMHLSDGLYLIRNVQLGESRLMLIQK